MNQRTAALLPLLLVLIGPPAVADSETLGRLFYTPQQRAALDRQRLLNPNQRNLQYEGSYTINGEVRRSGGQATRWINGTAETGQPAAPAVPVGDTFHPGTGERQDILRGGRIIIQRNSQPARP